MRVKRKKNNILPSSKLRKLLLHCSLTLFFFLLFTICAAGVVSSRTSTPKLIPSTAEPGFQLANASVSTLKASPSLGDTSFQRTSSFVFTSRLRSSPIATDFQTFVASTLHHHVPQTGNLQMSLHLRRGSVHHHLSQDSKFQVTLRLKVR